MSKDKVIQVRSIAHLKKLCKNHHDFFIALNHGIKSSKDIEYDSKINCFYILNLIDGGYQQLTDRDLMNKDVTNIGTAIKKGAFYVQRR